MGREGVQKNAQKYLKKVLYDLNGLQEKLICNKKDRQFHYIFNLCRFSLKAGLWHLIFRS